MIATAFGILSVVLLVYVIVLQLTNTALVILGWLRVADYVRRRPLRSYRYVAHSKMSMPVSILVPAYNEEHSIVSSVKSLIESQFLQLEIVVINDGSTDATLDAMISGFDMIATERVPGSGLATQPIRDLYVSRTHPNIAMIDKENGGKADSLNAGINYARFPLVCAIDADTLLDPGALSRLVWEFQGDEDTVAVGGIVRVVNGSRFEGGRLVEVQTPRTFIANVQIIEYLRAFLGGRIGWSRIGALLIISGAFGLFRKEAVIEAGGYDPTTVGEDAELVLRLYRTFDDQGKRCRVTFFPDPICWTEAPSSWRILTRQRDRWQRGLAELLWKHRDMFMRPKYGRIGFLTLPYFWIFELLGPFVEVGGFIVVVLGLIFGFIYWPFALLLATLSFVYGLSLSLIVILIEQRAYARYPNWRDLARLGQAAVIENFGYRQYLAIVRVRAFWTLLRKTKWGEMERTGFVSE